MNDSDDRASSALRQLTTSAVPVERPERIAERRERLLPALYAFADAEMARSEKKPGWRRSLFLAAAVAGMAFGGAFLLLRSTTPVASIRSSAGTVHVLHGGVSSSVSAPQPLTPSDSVETVDGTVQLGLVTGALVDLGTESRLELGTAQKSAGTLSERVVLASGRVSVHVPKLPTGSKLMVGTPDATITVHGTAFTVEVAKDSSGAAATSVAVTEGLVSVESTGRQVFLGPGSHWSSAVPAPTAAPAVAPPTLPAPIPAPSTIAQAARHSTLGAENGLFRAAMSARKNGYPKKAVELVDRLLHSFPGTPLGAEARALRSDALGDLGRGSSP